MVYFFLVLVAGLVWTLWFILQLNVLFPLIATVVLVVVALALGGWRFWQARRGAGALERAIAEQGRQQEMSARPEKRAEIQALQQQIQGGISALKSSSLGGKARGAAALYALHRRVLIYNGREDTVVAMQGSTDEFFADLNQRVVAKGGRAIEWAFVDGASHRPWFVTTPVAEWLAGRNLSIEGQTRIAGWAWENGVDLDPLYATYDREGGTLALGRAVTALRRAELHVFSEADWQRERGRLIHEAWLERARKG